MKNKIIKKLSNKVTNLLIIMLLLTFILPYYVNADTEDEEKRQAVVPAAAAKVLEGITTVTANSTISTTDNSTSSSDNTSNATPSGEEGSVIQTTSSSETGYTGIFKSGTTGREFKEYKQNISGWDSKYKINDLAYSSGWTSECGVVSVITVGSGYSNKATFEDVTSKLRGNAGSSALRLWTNEYTGQSIESWPSYGSKMSKSDFINGLSSGCVAIVHSSSYSTNGHYMAVLDISKDKTKVYLSNPWEGDSRQGWLSINTVYDLMDSIVLYTNDGSSVSYGGTGITSLDNFLFIGDSRTAGIESNLRSLGSNITAIGVGSSTPGHWKTATKTGSGTVLATNVTLPSKDKVTGVSVALGVNNTSGVEDMKKVLNNLLTLYPNTPIFVNSVFYVGSGYSYGTLNATTMNSNIDKFNNDIKEFCNSNSNLIYIDITTGLHEAGALKSAYTNDELHLQSEGNKKLVENIKDAILSSGVGSSAGNSYTIGNLTSNISQYITENGRGGYKIDIDLDEKVEEMLEILEEQNNNDVDNFLKTSNKKEYLKAMLKAELITQFPDLRSADEIEASKKDEEQMKNIKENIPKAIESLEVIHNATENLVTSKEFETEEALNTAIEQILKDIQYESKTEEENTIYTYVKDEKNYRLEKIGKESYNLYETDNGEVTEQEQYVFDSLKKESVQDKIYNIIIGGNITQENVKSYFYTTLSNVSSTKGYNADEMVSLYFSYINKIHEKLAELDDSLADWLSKLLNPQVQVPENELQGVIKIKKKTINTETGKESSKYLSYIPYDEFKDKCNNTDSSVLEHFTINHSGAIIVAKWKQEVHQPIGIIGDTKGDTSYADAMVSTATYKITESSPLSYLSQIYQHTMPFELLWTLLVYSGDKEFVYDLTNLVFNSEITITALETITESSNTTSHTVYIDSKQVSNAQTSDEDISTEDTDSYSYVVQYQDYYKESNVQLKVSYVDSWIATYTNNDDIVDIEESDNSDNPETGELEGTDWEQQGETQQADSNKASVMVNSNPELLEKYKTLQKEKLKENVDNYTNSSIAIYNLTNAKNIIKNNEELQETYISNMIVAGMSIMSPEQLGSPFGNINMGETNTEIFLNEATITAIEQATSDITLQLVIKQILKDIYNTGDWKVEIESGTVENYTKIDKIETKEATITKTYKYTTTSGQIVEKTDRNAEEDNFVTLLCKNGKAKGSLRSIASWMFESIERNQVLCDKLDLMKYLVGIAFGRTYGVDEFDFSIFDPENFKSIGGTGANGGAIGLSRLSQFVAYFENSSMRQYLYEGGIDYNSTEYIYNCITEDKKYYKMCNDIGLNNNMNFGFGVLFWSDGTWYNVEKYAAEGINVKDSKNHQYYKSLAPVESVNRIKEQLTEEFRKEVLTEFKEFNLKEHQVDALVNCRYRGALYYPDALDAARTYGVESQAFKNAVLDLHDDTARARANWILFTTGKYTDGNGNEMKFYSTDTSTTGGSILECAETIHAYMEQNNYTYSTDVNKLVQTFNESKQYKVTCCATYVSWVLRDAGYINETIHGANSLASALQNKYNFKKVNASELKAGDIMVKNGHVQIYAGNGQIYNAGYTGAIQCANPYNSSTDGYYGLRAPN